MPTFLAIIGHPVSQSLSPVMHKAACEAVGVECRFETMDVESDDLPEAVASLREQGCAGWSVTMPHKQAIMPLLDRIEPDAETIGAVNTVVRENDALIGLNTDVLGIRTCLTPFKSRVDGASVAVLGAGGAARAVVFGLLKYFEPASLLVLNRTVERAEELASSFSALRPQTRLSADSLFVEDLQKTLSKTNVIVNATSVGMKPYTDATPLEDAKFNKDQLIVDIIYAPQETVLLRTAAGKGATVIGGMEMLLGQGGAAFERWTGKQFPTDIAKTAIAEALKQR